METLESNVESLIEQVPIAFQSESSWVSANYTWYSLSDASVVPINAKVADIDLASFWTRIKVNTLDCHMMSVNLAQFPQNGDMNLTGIDLIADIVPYELCNEAGDIISQIKQMHFRVHVLGTSRPWCTRWSILAGERPDFIDSACYELSTMGDKAGQ